MAALGAAKGGPKLPEGAFSLFFLGFIEVSWFTPNLTPTLRGSTRATVFALFLGLRRTLRHPYASLRSAGFKLCFLVSLRRTLRHPYASLRDAHMQCKPPYAKPYASLTRLYAHHCFCTRFGAYANLTPCLREPTRAQGWQDATKQNPETVDVLSSMCL